MKTKTGAPQKFPNKETKKLRIEKVVLSSTYEDTKQQVSDLINKLQNDALTKCANEALKQTL